MVLQSMSGISKCVICYIVWQKIYCNVYKVSPGVSTRIKYGTITSLAKKKVEMLRADFANISFDRCWILTSLS